MYDKDHYRNQEMIYKRIRPGLLCNTLVVPTPKIQGHIRDLAANDYFGLKQQIEAFHQTTNKRTTDSLEHQSSVVHLDTIHLLQTYTIEVV